MKNLKKKAIETVTQEINDAILFELLSAVDPKNMSEYQRNLFERLKSEGHEVGECTPIKTDSSRVLKSWG